MLDALIAGVNIVELDPADDSVGYGGLPNADGIVQLDSCCMHGPRKKAGGVGALEGVKTPSLVAKAVMEKTDHHLLVGKDAQTFARNLGFEIVPDLNTPNSRAKWLEWKQRTDPLALHQGRRRARGGVREGDRQTWSPRDSSTRTTSTARSTATASTRSGEVCGVTTTSGLAWKIPGRLGDSPILGAGLYVDGDGRRGRIDRPRRGQPLQPVRRILIVEEMRRGTSPKDAGMTALRRIKDNTVEKRLLNARGLPNFNVNFYIINRRGDYAGVAMYNATGKGSYAVCDAKGPRHERLEPLLEGGPTS